MDFLTLNNGIQMPLVGFGTFMLGGESCTEAVAAAIESGYRMIDTAEAYGNEMAVCSSSVMYLTFVKSKYPLDMFCTDKNGTPSST